MKFAELFSGLKLFKDEQIIADLSEMTISGIALDSRNIVEGSVFFALAGAKQHGLMHVGQAIKNGACVIVYDPSGDGKQLATQVSKVPMLAVADLGLVLGEIAARFYGHPSRQMDVIGITGTNGKTSCSQFLSQMLDDCGVIGTLGWGEWGNLNKTLNTTPDALSVQQILADLLMQKKVKVAMEVSSHGLEQGRVNGVNFKGAVFTNISRDHLDYHGTMTSYLDAKLALLKSPGLAFAVVNLDSDYSTEILAAVPQSVPVWGVSSTSGKSPSGETVFADEILHKAEGIEFSVHWRQQQRRISVPLYGDFNLENVLIVLTVMLAMGVEFSVATEKLAQIKPVVGRMERFGGANKPLVFVDYAHTPDALDKVLASLHKHCGQNLWVVFGCGGNRDTGKRPLMASAAERWADHVIVTDDNPRFEESAAIIKDIMAGYRSDKVEIIPDRKKAIQQAVINADHHDYIVIAGKGHEDYQEINGIRLPFSDQQCVIEALSMRD